jgi:hypothetical protein
MARFSEIERRVGDYYGDRLRRHGPTHRGVDWNSDASQALRFEQLLRVVDVPGEFSLNDWGCGYGALASHLRQRGMTVRYHGHDVAPEMIAAARESHDAWSACSFSTSVDDVPVADYTVASGIFNVLAGSPRQGWSDYVHATVERMASVSLRGIAFNMLTSWSDPERMADHLHYADPAAEFDWCKRELSRDVALLHDYGLYEFTLIVRFDPGERQRR